METNFIIAYQNKSLPEVGFFMPSIWKCEDFASENSDYYYSDREDGNWTYLNLSSDFGDTDFHFVVFREEEEGVPTFCQGIELKPYFQYIKEGRYQNKEKTENLKIDAISKFEIETSDSAMYQEFLTTVASFLEYTNGYVLDDSLGYLDYNEFCNTFLKK